MLVIAALTVISVALIDRLGMIAALALLLLGLTRILGGSWRTAGLTAIALPLGLYILFGRWLQVPLPRGPWGF
jgi:putative tricarboxylic transport membrane protein